MSHTPLFVPGYIQSGLTGTHTHVPIRLRQRIGSRDYSTCLWKEPRPLGLDSCVLRLA
jgi:hypothetical protein